MSLRVDRYDGWPEELWGRWSALSRAQTEAGGSGAPFTGPEFQRAWWSVFGEGVCRGPSVIALETEEGGLSGAAALLRCDGQLRFAGDHEVSDYLGPTVASGSEEALAEAVLDELESLEASEGAGATADLRGLPRDSGLLRALPPAASARGWSVEVLEEAVCPTVDVSDGWEAYVAGLRKRDRRETRRKLRGLRELGGAVTFESWSDAGSVSERLPALLSMMAESRADKAEFLTGRMVSFFERLSSALSEAGWLRLYQLSVSGTAAAMVLCFEAGEELLLYNSGFDPRYRELQAGLGSKVLCIRDAVERGFTRVNFLRGEEPYKLELGGSPSPVRRLVLKRVRS